MATVGKLLIVAVLFFSILLLAACAGAAGEVVQSTQIENPVTDVVQAPTVEAPTAAAAAPTAEAPVEITAELPQVTVTEDQMATAVSPTETAPPPPAEAVDVTFFTPAQQEGPYYTVEKPADRDNDLATLSGAAGSPAGEVLEFGGTLYDAGGYPIEGAMIEIWQTDAAGVYLHPNDPGTENRDRNFQFYGEAQTDVHGAYSFRTILPGLYEPRPRHIHVKVRRDGQELLTTQFYFAGEIDLQGAEALMLIDARPGVDGSGNAILTGERDIFVDVDASGG